MMQSIDPSSLASVLQARLDRLEQRLKSAEERVQIAEGHQKKAENRMRAFSIVLISALSMSVLLPVASPSLAQGYGTTLQQILTRLAALEAKTDSMNISTVAQPDGSGGTISVPTVTFSGVNLQIVNGMGGTDRSNGEGNLIIGYNELIGGDNHSGSHNLIIGSYNSYTANAYGGMVVGYNNVIGGNFSSASGSDGTASGDYSNISGGSRNTASGYCSSVSGGYANMASNNYSSVSGGSSNMATGEASSVSGGAHNAANGFISSVSGGYSATNNSSYGWTGGTLHSP